MNRREILDLVTAVGFASMGAAAVAADAPPAANAAHDHATAGGKYSALIAATSQCVNAGDACVNHCLMLLGQGDTTLAACARTVRDTIAACTALRELAAANSPHVAALAKVVAGVCRDCKAECDKHEKHQVCRECGEACAQCAKECDRAAV